MNCCGTRDATVSISPNAVRHSVVREVGLNDDVLLYSSSTDLSVTANWTFYLCVCLSVCASVSVCVCFYAMCL